MPSLDTVAHQLGPTQPTWTSMRHGHNIGFFGLIQVQKEQAMTLGTTFKVRLDLFPKQHNQLEYVRSIIYLCVWMGVNGCVYVCAQCLLRSSVNNDFWPSVSADNVRLCILCAGQEWLNSCWLQGFETSIVNGWWMLAALTNGGSSLRSWCFSIHCEKWVMGTVDGQIQWWVIDRCPWCSWWCSMIGWSMKTQHQPALTICSFDLHSMDSV